MRVPLFQLDAFTDRRFAGNPAAVMRLPDFPDDATLLALARENNLSETAFLVPAGDGAYRLRWFTPAVEVPLCGHGTLAAAAAVLERLQPAWPQVTFHTLSGPLPVRRSGEGYVLDFPARPTEPVAPPPGLREALGVEPEAVRADRFNYLAVLGGAEAVRRLTPGLEAVARLDRSGLIVTAPGDGGYDLVSRYFAPRKGIPEDPVTGAAHCALAPYWGERLGKRELLAFQASSRGGELRCRLKGDRVELEGRCVFYLEGAAEV